MAMAGRVAEELSLPPSRVSYQIRYDATTSATTSVKFMTDGVLLRELASDFLLNKYSVVIVDEAHERSVNTDVLIGTLSRVVRLRESLWREGKQGVKPLRLIIMSATLRVTDFTENKQLFKTSPPLINVAARQYPVVTHFNRKTKPDYLTEAYKKVSKIHARLPPGGVLVFLTGQNEITTLCKRLEKRFGGKAINERVQKRKKAATGASKWRLKDEEKDLEDVEADQKDNITATSSRNADVEAEEIDLGYKPKDLATDVDEGIQLEEVDEDALDSDYDEDDPDGLFADREEDSDSESFVAD
jgi:ATP-dependent RNA helicase DHX37/DHR1